MEGYGAETYGQRWVDVYDDLVAARLGKVTQSAVDVLTELADDGPVLELGIGTGRLAVPLAARGLDVHGIDASTEMVATLRSKAEAEAISVTVGDFAEVGVKGRFGLVFCVANTFFALTSQADQVRCFSNVASHLTERGVFVVEAFVPDPSRLAGGQAVRALDVAMDSVGVEVSRIDPVAQTIDSQHVAITEDGIRLRPIHLRFAWPSELDLMARLAGLELRQRWDGWDRLPFSAASRTHVSVYAPSG